MYSNNNPNNQYLTRDVAVTVNVDTLELARSRFDSMDISPETRADYKYRIPVFIQFVSQNKNINIDTFRQFKEYLIDRTDLSASTKQKFLSVSKIFLQHLHYRERILPVDITWNTKPIKTENGHQKFGFTQEEIDQIENKLKTLDNSLINLRTKAMFYLMAFQGLRTIEVIRLNCDDIDLHNGTAKVQGKGKISKKLIRLHPDTTEALQNYIKVSKSKSGILFKSNYGKRDSEGLTTLTVRRGFEKILKELNIKNKSCHSFRHYFVTSILNVVGMRTAQKFSRHSSIESVAVYDDEQDVKKYTDKIFKCFGSLRLAETI